MKLTSTQQMKDLLNLGILISFLSIGLRNIFSYSNLLAQRNTPTSPTWVVAKKSPVGDILSDVHGCSTYKNIFYSKNYLCHA